MHFVALGLLALSCASLGTPALAAAADPPARAVSLGAEPEKPLGETAKPDPERARAAQEKLRRGIELFEKGEYEQAIDALKAGYAIEPRTEFLYALGQSERRRGNCVKAVEYYKQFLAANPPERQAEATRVHVERCERVVEDMRKSLPGALEPTAPATTENTTPGTLPNREVDSAGPAPWYKDWVGGALCGAGLVSVGLGTMFMLNANGALDGANTYGAHVAAAEDGKSQRLLGTVLLGAGGGLIAGGILRYVLHSRGGAQTTVAPTAMGSGRSIAVAISGAF